MAYDVNNIYKVPVKYPQVLTNLDKARLVGENVSAAVAIGLDNTLINTFSTLQTVEPTMIKNIHSHRFLIFSVYDAINQRDKMIALSTSWINGDLIPISTMSSTIIEIASLSNDKRDRIEDFLKSIDVLQYAIKES